MWFHVRLLEKCNLRCTSCYARDRDRTEIMSFNLFREVCNKIEGVKQCRPGFSVIYLSGGEPLLHPDFFEILDHCYKYFKQVTILTNGILLKDNIKALLKYRDLLCVQVSLDGDKTVNDRIRGPGVFACIEEALFLLKENNIKHWISYTVSQANKDCYKAILGICNQTASFFNNVTPYTGTAESMLSYYEWKEFKYRYESCAGELGMSQSHGDNCCGFRYTCGANYSGLTVNPGGQVAGCARINNICGGFERMECYLRDKPWFIQETCMQSRWGSIKNFPFLTRLE